MKIGRLIALVLFLALLYFFLTLYFSQQGGSIIERNPTPEESPSQIEERSVVPEPEKEEEEVQPNTELDTVPGQDTTVLIPENVAEKPKMESPFNSLKVSKRDGELIYTLNGNTTENLIASLADLDLEKDFVINFSGNITHREEQSVLEMLDSKGLEYIKE